MPRQVAQYSGGDDPYLTVVRRDISGGANNRQIANIIAENQVAKADNIDLSVPGQGLKRKGTNLLEDLGNDAGTSAFGFEPIDGTEQIVVTHGQKVETSTGTTFTERKADVTTDGAQTKIIQTWKSGGDGSVLLISNGTDDIYEMDQSHSFTSLTDDGDDAPPKGSTVMASFRGRLWILKDGTASYSDAYPSDFTTAFAQGVNAFTIPVGKERAIIPLRDTGLVFFGSEKIVGLNPSTTPAATDQPSELLDIGCLSNKSVAQVGDDIYFLARDGVRGLFRTIQDKVQLRSSEPISFVLKEEVDSVSWSYAHLSTAVWYRNKYYLAIAVDGSTYNNEVWVFNPATNGWSVYTGLNVGDWARVTLSGEERLFYIDSNDGSVYEMEVNDTDEDSTGTAVNITYTETGRKEDMGKPLQRKIGGDVCIRCEATSGNLTVEIQFDDGGFNTIGTIALGGNLITFPVSFPVNFLPPNISFDKFPIDTYGSWYQAQVRLTHSAGDSVKVLERSIVTHLEEYKSDDYA